MINPSGAVGGNSQNVPQANVPRTVSTFPLKYHFFNTHRFGEYTPHYVEDGVKNDRLPIRSSHEVRSYTLEAPLMQNITRSKDYFMVPMEAILPNNWEKFFDNPVRGDDVLNDVGPTVENFWAKVYSFSAALNTQMNTVLNSTSYSDALTFQALCRYFVLLEYFYSNGSLLSSLGCHGAPYCYVEDASYNRYSFDYFFDQFFAIVAEYVNTLDMRFNFTLDGVNYDVVSDSAIKANNNLTGYISLRHALCLMRDNPTFVVNSLTTPGNFYSEVVSLFNDMSVTFVTSSIPLDLSRVWAYQLVCSHYYSNDHIDYIYSAELYRQLIGSYIRSCVSSISALTFSRNGITYEYDWLSAHYCTVILSSGTNNALTVLTASSSWAPPILGYFSALFGYRRSLRYLDYFTGSRSQPLAVSGTGMSSTDVPVANNAVSVLDVTRSIQAQRFLNAVNRVRHNFEGYLKGVFGGSVPAPDYHNPFYLAHTDDTVFGQETENTGAAQMTDNIAITTNLRSNGARYMVECSLDRPAVVIGITHYDLPRVYSTTIERSFFHVDRFDRFNPFMQFVGDQQIYQQELGITSASLSNFAYTLRHMEYKQRYNQASGGFVENLPGWIFLNPTRRGSQYNINPDWIRSVNSEFDSFFVNLTGWSNGSYFHFIVDDYNDVSGQRPMAYAPSIL